MTIVTVGESRGVEAAPVWAQDAVMRWAREHGCAPGTLRWNPLMQCWEIHLALKEDDPRLKAWQSGTAPEKPTEVVFLHVRKERQGKRPRMVGLSLEDLGERGLREILDRGNLLSGRGEFKSLMESVRAAAEQREALREKRYRDAEQVARDNSREKRRSALGIPALPVGIDLKEKP